MQPTTLETLFIWIWTLYDTAWDWSASLNATHFIAFAVCYAVGRRHGGTTHVQPK